jgi:DNA helicase-2/ATP-dependent DNA helicase PcrA
VKLNDAQQEAVDFGDGVLQILAAAGSGKTRVLTERVVSLIGRGVDPESILALAFNKKAATELQERLVVALGSKVAEKVCARTFHSLGYSITIDNQYHFGLRVKGVVGGRQNWYIDNALEDANLAPEAEKGALYCALRYAKMHDMDASEYDDYLRSENLDLSRRLVPAMRNYEAKKRAEGLIDFDDMIFYARRALIRFPFAREKWSSQFKYVLVDEFQDVDVAQFDIVRLLSAPENNLTVVGDDFQSIYSFRGADPSFSIEFNRYFPTAYQVYLVRNYRSTQPIIEVSNRLIAVNENQVKKELVSETPSADIPFAVEHADASSEAAWVANDISGMLATETVAPEHCAILYRTNAQAAFSEIALMRHAIPYQIQGGFSFYSRKEIKDIIAYLSLAIHGDDESFERIYNKPNRYLGKAFLAQVSKLAGRDMTMLQVCASLPRYGKLFKPYHIKNAQSLCNIVARIRHLASSGATISDTLEGIVRATGYEAFLKKDVDDNEPDNDVMANLNALYEVSGQFNDANTFLDFIVGMQKAGDTPEDGKPSAVTLSSLHRAKGLEWERVYLVGVSEGLLPHKMSDNLEEERRLAYVGLTRGKESVRIGALRSYNGIGMTPSRFIAEAGIETQEVTLLADARSSAGEL